MAFIIPCSNKKDLDLLNQNRQQSNLQALSFNHELNEQRLQLIQEYEQINLPLNWNFCLPAWQLYRGRIYTRIENDNWNNPNSNIIIVSALFGIIKHTDLIPNYDIAMGGNLNNINLHIFWRDVNLNQFVNPDNDIDLLSKNYRKAFNELGNEIAIVPQNWNDRYGTHRGIWLNNELNQL